MGCNAWNHPSDCMCGWGGDTGGGGRRGTFGAASQVRRIPFPNGFEWNVRRAPSLDTYVNPNARCPVCDAEVFFYRSPHNGRVFFDELGPPWPKHPCTDNYLSRGAKDPILPPHSQVRRRIPLGRFPLDWQPFIPKKIETKNGIDCLELPTSMHTPGKHIYLPRNFFGAAPMYWRRSSDDPSRIELMTITVTAAGQIEQKPLTVPAWFNGFGEYSSYKEGDELSPATLSAIGWSLSFTYQSESNQIWRNHPGVDFTLARKYFESAAQKGNWVAMNNLGVMKRDGLGANAEPIEAFYLFRRAASVLDPIPLKHLARCYREGIGTVIDAERAIWLEALCDI